jgi:hypothetical protein
MVILLNSLFLPLKKMVRHLCHYEGSKKQQTTFKDSFNKIASFIVQKKKQRKKKE